jgi:general secretion pathway protein F
MPIYKYKTINEEGVERKHENWFYDYEELTTSFNTGEFIIELKIKSGRAKVMPKDKLLSFTGQLGSLVGSGMNLRDSLYGIKENNNDKEICELSSILMRGVETGNSLSSSLKQLNMGIPTYYISAIEGGEESNNLENAINFLYEYIKNIENDKKKVTNALMYPALVFAIAMIASTYMLVEVVPAMSATYSSLQKELPATTQIIISISEFVREWGVYLLGAIIVLLLAIKQSYGGKMKHTYLRIMSKLPMIGKILMTGDNYNILMTTGLLIKQGIPVDVALSISSRGIFLEQNLEGIKQAIRKIREGQEISGSLHECNIVDSAMVGVLRAGELSNKVGERFLDVAKLIKEKQDSNIKKLITILGPASILLIGGLILFIAMGLLMPMFEMNNV